LKKAPVERFSHACPCRRKQALRRLMRSTYVFLSGFGNTVPYSLANTGGPAVAS